MQAGSRIRASRPHPSCSPYGASLCRNWCAEGNINNALVWDGIWAWSIPLIVVTVIFHVICLVFVHELVIGTTRSINSR